MQNYNLIFYPKKRKDQQQGPVDIYARITLNGKRSEISTGECYDPEKWSTTAGRPVNTTTEDAKMLVAYLETVRRKIFAAFQSLHNDSKEVSAESIKSRYLGKDENHLYLVKIFEDHNNKVQELLGKEFAAGTLERYKTSLKHTIDFLKWKYKVSDIDIRKIDHAFITEYEFYLRTVRNCNNNSAVKYIKNFGKIIRICMANGWIEKNPFANYKAKVKEVERVFLTDLELNTIQEKDFRNERLNTVRDIFLFSCYTGLAYADVKKLSSNDLVLGIDGDLWIQTNRQKTDTKSTIPLLPQAALMIEKYKSNPKCQNEDRILPILSNQKMKHDIQLSLDGYIFEVDPRFGTTHDYKVAKILTHDLLQVHLEDELAYIGRKEPESALSEFPKNKLTWTDNKNSLIELIYALYTQGSLENGKVDIKELATYFESVFNIDLGDYYRTYLEIRMRKNGRTKFLSLLQDSLTKRMDQADEK